MSKNTSREILKTPKAAQDAERAEQNRLATLDLKQHPLSAAFPAMGAEDLAILQADIKANGQRDPIVILDKMVLDGWHRYQACAALGITPATRTLGRGLDPVSYVQSVNLHRRHLTSSQRAAAVTACQDWAQSGDNQHTRGGAPGSPPTVKEMAKAAEVSPRTIQQAKKAQEAGLGAAVRDGRVSAKKAADIAKLPEPERQAATEAPAPPKTKKPAPKLAAPPIPPDATDQTEVEQLRAELDEVKDRAGELAEFLQSGMDENKALVEENERLHRVLDAEDLLQSYNKEVVRAYARADIAERHSVGLQNSINAHKQDIKKWQGWAKVLKKKLDENGIEIKRPVWQTGEPRMADPRPPITADEL